MAIRYYYGGGPDEDAVEITGRIWTALEWNSSAEELDATQSDWVVEDPESDIIIYAWHRVWVLDDSAPTDHTVIGMGSIADVHIRRSEVYGRTPTSRAWHLTITDINYDQHRRLFDAEDSPSRPAETDLARVAWLLTTGNATLLASGTDYIDTTGGANLDAYDWTTQSSYDMLTGAMEQSGRNAFVLYDESKGPPDFEIPAAGELQLWYANTGSDLWASDIFLTNDSTVIDTANQIYPLSDDHHDLHLDPTRIYWKLNVAYDGGLEAVEDLSIAALYGARETTIDAGDVTSQTKALARGNRMLQEGSTPTVRVEWGYNCKSVDVNSLMAGQSFQYQATHLGGLTDLGVPDFSVEGGVTLRAMDRSVVEKAPGVYYVSGSAVVPVPALGDPVVAIDCEFDLNEPHGTVTDGGGNATFGTPSNANDGDEDTTSGFGSGVGAVTAYLKSDLGSSYPVAGMVLVTDMHCSEPPEGWDFWYSDNGTDWTPFDMIVLSNVGSPSVAIRTYTYEVDGGPIDHRYWRIGIGPTGGGYFCGGNVHSWCIVGTG